MCSCSAARASPHPGCGPRTRDGRPSPHAGQETRTRPVTAPPASRSGAARAVPRSWPGTPCRSAMTAVSRAGTPAAGALRARNPRPCVLSVRARGSPAVRAGWLGSAGILGVAARPRRCGDPGMAGDRTPALRYGGPRPADDPRAGDATLSAARSRPRSPRRRPARTSGMSGQSRSAASACGARRVLPAELSPCRYRPPGWPVMTRSFPAGLMGRPGRPVRPIRIMAGRK